VTFIEEMSSRFGVKVRFANIENKEAFATRDADGYTVVLHPDLYPPRMNWRFCHELAHILLGHLESEVITRRMEWDADRKAAELMLPTEEVLLLIGSSDLTEINERFPHASWEAVCRRWAEFKPAVLTIFDNRCLTGRWGPEGLAFPRLPTASENAAVRQCYERRGNVAFRVENLDIQALFVDEGRGVERVILLTEISDL